MEVNRLDSKPDFRMLQNCFQHCQEENTFSLDTLALPKEFEGFNVSTVEHLLLFIRKTFIRNI